jgi:hypothetical protein
MEFNSTTIWDVSPCSAVRDLGHFGGKFCLQLEVDG